MSEKEHTLCFTGHRYYTGDPDDARLAEAIEAAYADGYRTFISGMAEGFDMAAAEAVLQLRKQHPDMRLIAAVPFLRQAAKYSEADKKRHEQFLAAADKVVILSPGYSYGCYYERDDWMTEHSSRIVCWYDGTAGGTRYTVRSALRRGLDIVNLYRAPDTLF